METFQTDSWSILLEYAKVAKFAQKVDKGLHTREDVKRNPIRIRPVGKLRARDPFTH